jgi:hypothetical protein
LHLIEAIRDKQEMSLISETQRCHQGVNWQRTDLRKGWIHPLWTLGTKYLNNLSKLLRTLNQLTAQKGNSIQKSHFHQHI